MGATASIDHGSLWGLFDDDHPQYLRKDATRPLDGDWNAGSHTITAEGIDVSAIAFDGQLTSTVETGTAPFVVASTTAVANLNADLLDGQHAAAFLTSISGLSHTTLSDIGSLTHAQLDTYLNQAVKTTSSPTFEAVDVNSLELAAGSITDTDGTIDFDTTDLQGIGSLAFGDFTSLVATGTAPFFCDSATVCTNLNSDLWDGYQFGDYLDQAVKTTSSPTFAQLTVSGTYTGSIMPTTDNSNYLGKNDDDTPLAYKGLILKDTTNGKYYRIEVISGVVTATDLTD